MESLTDVEVSPCRRSVFLRPLRAHYTQNGIRKEWDFVKTHDSVSVLIYHTVRETFVLVKQFRPAVYMCECARQGLLPTVDTMATDADPQTRVAVQTLPASLGVTYELCAGLVDKPGLSLEQVAMEEVQEECGYRVPLESLQKVTSYRSSVGLMGSKHTMFYTEVSDAMHVGVEGGKAEEGELIEVVHVPVRDWQAFALDEGIPKTAGVHLAFMWFQSCIAPRLHAAQCVSPAS
ncbi:uridine diphosphate glucose pyrophosphatase NUDT14 [Rhinoraja longicauda]